MIYFTCGYIIYIYSYMHLCIYAFVIYIVIEVVHSKYDFV